LKHQAAAEAAGCWVYSVQPVQLAQLLPFPATIRPAAKRFPTFLTSLGCGVKTSQPFLLGMIFLACTQPYYSYKTLINTNAAGIYGFCHF
jgi:hypothetical protein